MRKIARGGVCILAFLTVMGLVVFGAGCSSGSAPEGRYQTPYGVVQVLGPTDGIQLKNGNTKANAVVSLKETRGYEVKVSSIVWTLYTAAGDYVTSGYQTFMPHREINGGEKISVTVRSISLKGMSKGLHTISFEVKGYDSKYGENIGSITDFCEINIS